jgi:hypothetical protein
VSLDWNAARFARGQSSGFYESYFQRANHPTRPLAFWIRYTSFCPAGRPADARGELWAIYFDGESHRLAAVKQIVPMTECAFSSSQLDVRIGAATLNAHSVRGGAAAPARRIEWSLDYGGGQAPLLLLPQAWYERTLPKAKALVGMPNAIFTGTLTVDGETIPIDRWQGSQNHNWGTQHTDRYAWGQVAGFDNDPGAFLECSTAQIKLGPVWSPRLTLIVLRVDGHEYAINRPLQWVRTAGRYEPFTWTVDTGAAALRIHGRIHAGADAFVGLTYDNPPGGSKTCLNTKVASAEFTLARSGHAPLTLVTRHRAAFEILVDQADPRVPVLA